MKILWLSWKDIEHPYAGGAEVVAHNIRKRLAAEGHEIIAISNRFPDSAEETTIDGYKVIRMGHYGVYWHAYKYYRAHLQGWPDIVIDEMNTVPFFARWYVKEKSVLLAHQLAREIWFYQMSFPLSLVGYLLEPLYVWLLSGYSAITVSESSKQDLMRYGFDPKKISIISEGIEVEPLPTLDNTKLDTLEDPVFLSLGSIRPMKRTLHALRAFEHVADKHPSARLIVAGSAGGSYGERVLSAIKRSRHGGRIEVRGKVSAPEKIALMRGAHVLLVPSLKEGWGLVVAEAASQGTPTVVYDVDGLRDAVFRGEAGVISAKNTSVSMAEAALTLVSEKDRYASIRNAAWEKSKTITFDKAAKDFISIIEKI